MNKKYFLYLLFFSVLFGDLIIHDRVHSSPYGLPVSIKAFLEVPEMEIHRFTLLYRPAGNKEYIELPMIQISKSRYQAEIPGKFSMREFLEYYLLLELHHHTRTKYPSIDADKNPIRIQIDLPSDDSILNNKILPGTKEIDEFDIVSLEPDYIILSPKPGERIHRHNLFIALSYFPMKEVDPAQINVFLDELDVSPQAVIDSTYLTLPIYSIMPGIHTVRVKITNVLGQKYSDISWSFSILPGQVKSFGAIKQQSSRIKANYNGGKLSSTSLEMREVEFHHEIVFDWLQLEGQFLKTSLQNKYSQPYDRYSLNLKNEFLKIKFGDSYPHIDNYAWIGKRIRGVNILFNKNPISIEIINGKTLQALQGNPKRNAMVISSIDSTTDNLGITVSRDNYTFQQDVSAIKFGLSNNHSKWNINYIKIKDNISTVSSEVSNAEIILPDELMGLINPNISDSVITLEYLKNNLPLNSTLNLPTENWVGKKPKDNFIISSNFQFGLDDSRILVSSGFSISLMNRNKWNKINSITELDTLEYDFISPLELDGYFIGTVLLDSSFSVSNYEEYISFGQEGLPMIPFLIKQNNSSFSDFLNLSNLNRYSILQLRYLGHRVELGSKRNGPDYYSLLNPYLRRNYKEAYFSDRFSMFKSKLLFYYKNSKITEGLYKEIVNPVEIRRSIFNISLYPGSGLPTFNFGFIHSDRYNEVKTYKSVADTLLDENQEIDSIITVTIDNRINIGSRQFNISMTNQFKLWFSQVLSLNILISEQSDQVAKNVNADTLKSIGYLPKDAESESYAISLKSVYNNHWESNMYFNSSHFDYGQDRFDYNNDGKYDDYNQELNNYHFQLVYLPDKFFKKLIYGMYYSTGKGSNYFTQYNINMVFTSEPIVGLYLNMLFDYRIKYLGEKIKSPNDIIFRTQLLYDIF